MTAEVNPQQAEEYASRIPSIKTDTTINAEGLENLPAPTLSAIKRKEEREVGKFSLAKLYFHLSLS